MAVVTYLRDDSYVPLLRQLECTLRHSNPGLELGLMMVEGELGHATLAAATALNITLLPVAPLEFSNTYDRRCVCSACLGVCAACVPDCEACLPEREWLAVSGLQSEPLSVMMYALRESRLPLLVAGWWWLLGGGPSRSTCALPLLQVPLQLDQGASTWAHAVRFCTAAGCRHGGTRVPHRPLCAAL
jgi:hypothetical protein